MTLVLTACGQDSTEETGTGSRIEAIQTENAESNQAGTETVQAASLGKVPTADSVKAAGEPAVSGGEERELSAEEEIIIKTEFDFETGTVMLNSGYEMPINGLGTYSLHGDECISSVKSALSNGVRLIDTASAYGNEVEVGQAIREAIDEGIIQREDVFVITKIYPGDEMKNPVHSSTASGSPLVARTIPRIRRSILLFPLSLPSIFCFCIHSI